jgi:hypothetical protein
MVCDIDIWQAANDLIGRYGHRALARAVERAENALRVDDHMSHRTWCEISRVVDSLQKWNRARPWINPR